MYKIPKYKKTQIKTNEKVEGETIETKVERLLENKEPIKDGAPIIHTERKEGIISAYNIRTDRWEIATEAMDYVQKSIQAKRDAKYKKDKPKKPEKTEKSDGETKVIDINQGKTKDSGGTTSVQGNTE